MNTTGMYDFITRVRTIEKNIELPFGLKLYTELGYGSGILRVGDPDAKDNVTGEPYPWKGRKWLLSPRMTDGEIVQTAFLAAQVAIEHETRELFKYKGQSVFDPHYDINKLVDLRAQPDALKEREDNRDVVRYPRDAIDAG